MLWFGGEKEGEIQGRKSQYVPVGEGVARKNDTGTRAGETNAKAVNGLDVRGTSTTANCWGEGRGVGETQRKTGLMDERVVVSGNRDLGLPILGCGCWSLTTLRSHTGQERKRKAKGRGAK